MRHEAAREMREDPSESGLNEFPIVRTVRAVEKVASRVRKFFQIIDKLLIERQDTMGSKRLL